MTWINYTGRRSPEGPEIMPAKPYTANKGASETRRNILRKMKELDDGPFMLPSKKWNTLREYIKTMAKRASKKTGGLGRR